MDKGAEIVVEFFRVSNVKSAVWIQRHLTKPYTLRSIIQVDPNMV